MPRPTLRRTLVKAQGRGVFRFFKRKSVGLCKDQRSPRAGSSECCRLLNCTSKLEASEGVTNRRIKSIWQALAGPAAGPRNDARANGLRERPSSDDFRALL